MIHFRAPFVGGLFGVALAFQLPTADIVHAASMVEVPGRHVAALVLADNDAPAWAAEATMNPDYVKDDATSGAADSSEQPTSAEDNAGTETPSQQTAEDDAAPPPTGGKATTEYYGDSESPNNPAWAEPAKMNPDYATDQSSTPAPAATESGNETPPSDTGNASTEAPAAPAAEEAPPPPTGGKATTEYYGGGEAPSSPAWAEPAKMNPDYSAAETPASSGSSSGASACVASVTTDASGLKVHFSEDSAALSREDRAALTTLAKSLKDCAGAVLEVQGYTDNVGSADANKVLSELRAKKVADFLASAGVEASRLKSAGYGPDKPIGDNATSEGRRLNRRIELVVTGQ